MRGGSICWLHLTPAITKLENLDGTTTYKYLGTPGEPCLNGSAFLAFLPNVHDNLCSKIVLIKGGKPRKRQLEEHPKKK